ncbi:MAG: putative RND superfamily exporter protein, partial [Verrucomicrobiales bacterium]
AMRVLGWEWNFFSLGALLLTFGAGLDYSIHILLDRRHHGGEIAPLRQGVLRALGVCALSTIAGFASIAWASNQGLASLGRVCALALAINALVALVLLPWFLERFQPDGAV